MSKIRVVFAVAGLVLLSTAPALLAQGVVSRDIDYVSGARYEDGKDLLDVFMPEGANGVPVVVFFHGGALRGGDKGSGRAVAERLVPEGIGVVSASYRLSPTFRHPAHVEDAASATAWVLKNIAGYGGDPRRVYISGHSAGAYLAALLALDDSYLAAHGLSSDQIQGTIPISPFLYVEETAPDRPKDVWGDDPSDWLAASVTPHITSGKGPMLLIYAHGDDEWRRHQNDRFGEAMRAAGNSAVHVVEVPDRSHLSIRSDMAAADDKVGDLILRFIEGRH